MLYGPGDFAVVCIVLRSIGRSLLALYIVVLPSQPIATVGKKGRKKGSTVT